MVGLGFGLNDEPPEQRRRGEAQPVNLDKGVARLEAFDDLLRLGIDGGRVERQLSFRLRSRLKSGLILRGGRRCAQNAEACEEGSR
jgi:hypothetical protein